MSRQEDFKQASQSLEVQVISNPWTLFEKGCEHGYQYAVEKVCKWLSKNAKKYVCMICDSGATSVTYEDENLINDIRKAME